MGRRSLVPWRGLDVKPSLLRRWRVASSLGISAKWRSSGVRHADLFAGLAAVDAVSDLVSRGCLHNSIKPRAPIWFPPGAEPHQVLRNQMNKKRI